MNSEKVQTYYDYTLPFYRIFWHGNTRALHYGMWNSTTTNLNEALLNTNKFLADKSGISGGEKILDAGCGVGGSLLWLCQKFDVNGVGITISEKQLEKANELAKRLGLEKRCNFELQDYAKTNFPESSFDIVWAIESVCHAFDKKDFIMEAFRLLKPHGRLIVADGFIEKNNLSVSEHSMLQDFIKGLALENLANTKIFEKQLSEVGFSDIKNYDETEHIIPSSKIMKRMSTWSLPLSKLTGWLRITPNLLKDNNKAGIVQYDLFNNRILTYRVFSATKP